MTYDSLLKRILIGKRFFHLPLSLGMVDVGLIVFFVLMLVIPSTSVLMFHMSYVLLSLGAFYWSFRAFSVRAVAWSALIFGAILLAVNRGELNQEELIEIPMLLLIVVTVFGMAQRRARMQYALEESQYKEQVARLIAEDANRSKSTFLASMSHELRTPLNVIIGYNALLGEELAASNINDYQDIVGRIDTASNHLLSLLNNILDVSKIEAGKMDIHWSMVSLPKLIHDMGSIVQPLVTDKGSTLVLEVSSKLAAFRTDELKLRQILINLLGNAAKFTTNGTITLQAVQERRHSCDWLVVSVRDTGIGISPEQQQRLFRAFSQATIASQGTGLGLLISRRFAEMLGGTLTLESAVGAGSTFTITLPLVTE